MEATVAILYPGELGSSFARLLLQRGAKVVTALQGRSSCTARRCRDAGVTALDSLDEVVSVADVVVSMVDPAAAEEVAQSFCELAYLSPPAAIYVDANSVSPELVRSIAARIKERGREFVDASVNGLATKLASSGTLFLSGARAERISQLLHGSMRVVNLGIEPGLASAMKMLLGGLSKGICALFMELGILAEHNQMLPMLLEQMQVIYPGISRLLERMVPTYVQHSGRRAHEMMELQRTFSSCGLEPQIVAAIAQSHGRLAQTMTSQGMSEANLSLQRFLENLSQLDFTRTATAHYAQPTSA